MASDEAKPLDAAFLQEASRGRLIGSRVIVLASTGSTNDDAFQMGLTGSPPGLVVFAERQTAGRGRHGRQWESCAGKGLSFSILLKPLIAATDTARLTDWAAEAILNAVRKDAGVAARIKPPNDVYLEDKKVAGVLVEMRAQPKQPHLAIIGIGVNVNQSGEDFSPALREIATSLSIAKGRPLDREQFAASLLRRLDESYAAIFAP